MEESEIIRKFLEWYDPRSEIDETHGITISEYMGFKKNKQTKKEENIDWFLHTHWTENQA